MKVAIVHYWLVGMRGGEKVVEALCRMFPDADIFTHVYVPENVSAEIRKHRVFTTFINGLPRAARMYKKYLPLMPMALEQLDLRAYDLIISSESGPAKGIIPPPGALHICYCHSPMRYVWNMFHDYREGAGPITRLLMPPIAHYVRNWDALSSIRVDHYIANSANVAARVKRYYRREADVVTPPVDTNAFQLLPAHELEDYFLVVGELLPYKRPELAVDAFNQMRRNLVVIGGGEMLDAIRKRAGPTVSVLGPQPFNVLRHHYARCRALIFPGEEDFGIVPVEAMASGRPVIAYGRGGALETVVPGLSGIFFENQSVESIIEAVEQFDHMSFDSHAIRTHAGTFDSHHFVRKLTAHVNRLMASARTPVPEVARTLAVRRA
jgi:glycosyltransferase involved in cell wall biosynthesis